MFLSGLRGLSRSGNDSFRMIFEEINLLTPLKFLFTKVVFLGSLDDNIPVKSCHNYRAASHVHVEFVPLCLCVLLVELRGVRVHSFYIIKRGVILTFYTFRCFLFAKCVKSQNHPPFYTIKYRFQGTFYSRKVAKSVFELAFY